MISGFLDIHTDHKSLVKSGKSKECFVSADSGYRDAQKREELKDAKADWLIAAIFSIKMGKQNKNLKKAP